MAETDHDSEERSALELRRDHLLDSIEDLDAEFDAGDLGPSDRDLLRDSYVSRADDALERLELHHFGVPEASRPMSQGRRIALITGVAAVAVLAGVLLATSLGSRSDGDSLTGTDSFASRLAGCQSRSPADSIGCYDGLLAEAPKNPDALTYKAWAQYRLGDKTTARQVLDQVAADNPTYPDVMVFQAVALKDEGDFAGASKHLDALWALKPPAALWSTVQQMQLDSSVDYEMMAAPARNCWDRANAIATELSSSPTTLAVGAEPAGFADVIGCFDTALAPDPSNRDLLVTKAATIIGLVQVRYYADAGRALDTVIAADPGDATAHLLRAAVLHSLGAEDKAKADLDAVVGRTSGMFPLDVNRLRQAVDAALAGPGGAATSAPTGG